MEVKRKSIQEMCQFHSFVVILTSAVIGYTVGETTDLTTVITLKNGSISTPSPVNYTARNTTLLLSTEASGSSIIPTTTFSIDMAYSDKISTNSITPSISDKDRSTPDKLNKTEKQTTLSILLTGSSTSSTAGISRKTSMNGTTTLSSITTTVNADVPDKKTTTEAVNFEQTEVESSTLLSTILGETGKAPINENGQKVTIAKTNSNETNYTTTSAGVDNEDKDPVKPSTTGSTPQVKSSTNNKASGKISTTLSPKSTKTSTLTPESSVTTTVFPGSKKQVTNASESDVNASESDKPIETHTSKNLSPLQKSTTTKSSPGEESKSGNDTPGKVPSQSPSSLLTSSMTPVEEGESGIDQTSTTLGTDKNEGIYTQPDEPGGTHFMVGFISVLTAVVAFYLIYHNRRMIIIKIQQCQTNSHQGRQASDRPSNKDYQLINDGDVALTGLDHGASTKNYIY